MKTLLVFLISLSFVPSLSFSKEIEVIGWASDRRYKVDARINAVKDGFRRCRERGGVPDRSNWLWASYSCSIEEAYDRFGDFYISASCITTCTIDG